MKTAVIINIIIVLLEIPALGYDFKTRGWKAFIYYTVLSNLFAAITGIIYIFVPETPLTTGLQFLSTDTVAVTFLVVMFYLGPTRGYKNMLIKGAGPVVHFIAPILAVVNFIFFEKVPQLDVCWTWIAIFPTILYGAVAYPMNIIGKWNGPYSFLRAREQPVWVTVLWIIALGLLAYGIAWGLLALCRL